ncbi:MAG: ComEC/Rec2 family competence protein [Myxococcales bacterium]|nr:ComEC/Rec2 family competence protein [Myxococcales bacterium]
MRADSLLIVALSLAAGPLVTVAPAATLFAFVIALVLALDRVRARVLLLAVVAFAAGGFGAHFALTGFHARWHETRTVLHEPTRCAAVARVISSPTRHGDRTSFLAELSELECEGHVVGDLIARLHTEQRDLHRGDRLAVIAQLAPVELFRNRELPDPTPGAARRRATASGPALAAERVARGRGLPAWIDAARNRARQAIDRAFAPAAAPLARALVLGESDLAPEDDRAFRESGLSHLLAVSGTHLVFAVASLIGALTALLVRIERLAARIDAGRIAAAIGVPVALAYADFAGGSGSAWRAAWMLAASYTVRAAGRHPLPERTLAVSLIAGVCADPLLPFDVSFLLSAAATVGLVVLGRPFGELCAKVQNRALRFVAASVATTLSAMIPCAPLLALMSPDQTLAGVVANGFAAPIGEAVALPVCLLHPLVSAVPGLGRGVALVGSGALLWVRFVAHLGASAKWAAFPVPAPTAWHLAVLALAVVGAWFRRPRWASLLAGATAFAVVEVAAIRAGHPRDQLRITLLDVGQGDALLIDLPDGSLMLVDGGGAVGGPIDPGARVIAPVLRARRREQVDVVVLSHPHPDHFGGLAGALERVRVGELWDNGQGEREGAGPAYRALLASLRQRGTRVLRPAELCGHRRFGAATVAVLAPCPDFVPGRDGNDNSIVLALSLGQRRALLLGDAEREEEAELVARQPGALAADFVKLGHHGSRTSSSPALLAAAHPTHVGISCGLRNRFGHPHAETLSALRTRGIHTLRTDRNGAAFWLTDGRDVKVGVSVARAD